jgi:hypothetical protein
VESQALSYDPEKVYIVEVALGRSILVKMDGSQVAEYRIAPHPFTPDQIFFGKNPIGGGTTGTEFRGQMLTTVPNVY